MDYAELTCQSAFSFLRGASEPETLVEEAARLGYAALALTDRDGLYGCPRHHAAARATGLAAIHGTTLTLTRGNARRYDGRPEGADHRVVLLAQDEVGWCSLCRLVTAARHGSRTEPTTPLSALLGPANELTCVSLPERGAALPAHAGLLALAGPHLPDDVVEALFDGFGRERVFLAVHDRLLHRDRRGQQVQRRRAEHFDLPLLVTGGARFARRTDKPLHDVLTCVRHKVTLDEATTRLLPNAEFCLRPIERIAHLFRHCLDAVTRTAEVAERCTWDLGTVGYRFPPFEVPPGETPFSRLHQLVHVGARRRYRPMTGAAMRQISKELDLIERLELAGYFLVMHDIVRFCEREAILCQGRGSAANSAVCYALGITSVDPVGMGMLFERFLSEERGELPDIDLDIAHQDRERVLQYVYRRYGRERAAMAAEVITYRVRSAVRDAGKALGFSVSQVDALAKSIDRRFDTDRDSMPEDWSAVGDDGRLPHLLRIVRQMSGLPRHLSIHVGGMVITGPPLTDTMPVEPAAMPGRTVVPWDKDDLGSLGIIKIDLLGLGMLTALDRCLAMVNRTREEERAADEPLQLHTIPPDDEATWDMLCRADTVGVFQVESRAQMNCLPRLRPRCFYDLVIEVALIRPGPIQGNMVHPFLRRRAGREKVTYPHPKLEPILARTLGVPLFQEQGMRIAVTAAGFTPGEADELRRAMGHKRSHARMAALSERLVGGMVRNGIDATSAAAILKQLSSFADFGFPESHSASFARLVWISAWLKQHYPTHYLCAMLNAQPMGFYSPAALVSDAERHGVVVAPVDVLQSDWESTLQWMERERGPVLGVRLGLCTVRGLGESHAQGVRDALASVERVGPFVSPADFARRSGVTRGVMENLARLGALRGFDERRRQALWAVARMGREVPGPLAEPTGPEADVALPAQSVAEEIGEDYLLGGVSVARHPLSLMREELDAAGVLTAVRLNPHVGPQSRPSKATAASAHVDDAGRPPSTRGGDAPGRSPAPSEGRDSRAPSPATRAATGQRTKPRPAPPRNGERVVVAGMVICRQRPSTAKGVTFVTLEDETGFANLIVTRPVAARERAGLRAPLILAVGRVEAADGVVNIHAERLIPLASDTPLEGLRSHDYR